MQEDKQIERKEEGKHALEAKEEKAKEKKARNVYRLRYVGLCRSGPQG